MKPLTSSTLRIRINGLDNKLVEKIDFLFRISEDRHSKKIIQKTYTFESAEIIFDDKNNAYKLFLTPDETDKFPNNSIVWIDIRPILKNKVVVPVKILRFSVTPTLFTRGDVNDS